MSLEINSPALPSLEVFGPFQLREALTELELWTYGIKYDQVAEEYESYRSFLYVYPEHPRKIRPWPLFVECPILACEVLVNTNPEPIPDAKGKVYGGVVFCESGLAYSYSREWMTGNLSLKEKPISWYTAVDTLTYWIRAAIADQRK